MGLTFIRETGVNKQKYKAALYRCDCGKEVEWPISEVKRGRMVSCGCFKKNRMGKESITHGLSRHPIYKIWATVIQRCEDVKAINYERYGGRGVKMCEEWRRDFKKFYDWSIRNGWGKGLVLDKDIKAKEQGIEALLYSPDFCQYVSVIENNNCKRNTAYIEWDNEKLTLRKFAKKYNIKLSALIIRYYKGWSVERIINQPVRRRKPRKLNFLNHAFGYIN